MPPQTLFDISALDPTKVLFTEEEIRKVNPQRGDMEHLNAILHVDTSVNHIVGVKHVRDDEFWVPGHIRLLLHQTLHGLERVRWL
jgi:3-hydroxyacyl-[acyl-carrier-protein] dehydratase